MPVTYDACWLSLDMNAHGHLKGGTDRACGLCGFRESRNCIDSMTGDCLETRFQSKELQVGPVRCHSLTGTMGLVEL